MSTFMKVAIPLVATATAAYFTGGTSLAAEGAADAGTAVAADAATEAGTQAAAAAATLAASAAGTAGATAGATAGGASWLGSTIATASPYLKGAALIAQVGGTTAQAIGAQKAGAATQAEADNEATQLRQNANNEEGAAELKAQEQGRETAYVISNAQASAAAGGGSATDPTVTKNLSTIAGEGRFRALTDLYQGDAAAQASRNQADATQYGGKIAGQAGTTKMFSSILSGASSLYDKYGNVSNSKSSAFGDGTSLFLQGN